MGGGYSVGRCYSTTGGEKANSIPEVQAGDTSCELCHQSFESTHSLHHHMKTHTGDSRWSCDWSGKVLASKVMYELHMKGCSQEKGSLVKRV